MSFPSRKRIPVPVSPDSQTSTGGRRYRFVNLHIADSKEHNLGLFFSHWGKSCVLPVYTEWTSFPAAWFKGQADQDRKLRSLCSRQMESPVEWQMVLQLLHCLSICAAHLASCCLKGQGHLPLTPFKFLSNIFLHWFSLLLNNEPGWKAKPAPSCSYFPVLVFC